MTSLQDFHVALAANPNDFHLRGVYADFLDELTELVVCPACRGRGETVTGGYSIRTYSDAPCTYCRSTGTMNTLLAEGYRAMSVVRPVYDRDNHCWWGWQSGFPVEWWVALVGSSGGVEMVQEHDVLKALDRAALSLAALKNEVKERILTTGPWATKRVT